MNSPNSKAQILHPKAAGYGVQCPWHRLEVSLRDWMLGATQGQGGKMAFQCLPSSPLTRTHAL